MFVNEIMNYIESARKKVKRIHEKQKEQRRWRRSWREKKIPEADAVCMWHTVSTVDVVIVVAVVVG